MSGRERDVLEGLNRMRYSCGGTVFDAGLRTAVEILDAPRKGRTNAKRIIIFQTDGEGTTYEAQNLHQRGIEIFAVGVGYSVTDANLRPLASNPTSEHIFRVDNYDKIVEIKDALVRICKAA